MAYRPYIEYLTEEEKLEKARRHLSDPSSLVAIAAKEGIVLDDRTKERFYKLLHRKMLLQFNQSDDAAQALDKQTAAHLRRVTA